jgi:hypothetical protein
MRENPYQPPQAPGDSQRASQGPTLESNLGCAVTAIVGILLLFALVMMAEILDSFPIDLRQH